MPPTGTTPRIRRALPGDCGAIETLIAASARTLGRPEYTSEQIEGALSGAFGVDTQLIEDGTYFLAEVRGELAGCGGWSYRETLFGSDRAPDRSSSRIDPATGAAKIRAFFVHPDFARMGVGTTILERCERAAIRRGFRWAELMSTLPGLAFYQRHGYVAGTPIEHPLGGGLAIRFVPMSKRLADPAP